MSRMDDGVPVDQAGPLALQRMRLVSQALADAARRTRISRRSRRSYSAEGAGAQKGRWITTVGFYALVVVPSLAAIVYYSFVASDQYVSEALFTVGGGEPIPMDGLSSMTGIPAVAIVQDTQVVVNYLHSRAAVDKLQQMVDIRGKYGASSVDRLSRFNTSKPIENLVRYWDGMISTGIRMPSGAVSLKVRAFAPDDAVTIAQAAVDACEQLINAMNDRMRNDAVATAKEEVTRAVARLTETQIALEQARNDRGMLDVVKASDALNKLIADTQAAQLKLQEQYTAQLRFVSESAPQSRDLKSRIDATTAQLRELRDKLTSTQGGGRDTTLASAMSRFSELDLEHTVAQHIYAGAITALEAARLIAERKLMYLNTFVAPALPERAEYPSRGLMVGMVVLGGLLAWAAFCAGVAALRSRST